MSDLIQQKKPREGGIELFRCLLMFFIVLLHCSTQASLSHTLSAVLFFAITYASVDCFVAISGWFGIRFSWGKWFRLLGLYVFYLVGFFILRCILHKIGLLSGIPRFEQHFNWFAAVYLALMLFTPIVNAGLETLAQTPRKLITAWGLFALAITLSWAQSLTHLLEPFRVFGWWSNSFSTILFIYVTLRTVRLTNWYERVDKWIPLAAGTLYFGFIGYILVQAICFWMPNDILSCRQVGKLGYHAPIAWTIAVTMFLFFRKLRLPEWLSKVACFLAPSMFGVYLIHESPIQGLFYKVPMLWLSDNCPWMPTAVILLGCAAFTFAVSLGVDLLRRAGLAGIRWAWVRAAGRRAR